MDNVQYLELLNKNLAVICPDSEWEGVQDALFYARQNMGDKFPPEAQWFLNRVGMAWRNANHKRALENG